ncbi:hypothetical protein N7517_011157 [Penicillium concentricum]|uniref:DNA2/NAM7 helicase-like C-terminal domain-containing protein n=1 Tax=Penicillium concentricum TaxID=293559 RepID=A0A9W9RFF4_9EURO|nr:uncharacterized protein N7517_011157 [Penicillium concentricum]KAJ5356548.1 hypothetical protein N7517_011157 [Penicillium concentricum]
MHSSFLPIRESHRPPMKIAIVGSLRDHNKQEYTVYSNVVFLAHKHGQERQVQSSYANGAHCNTSFVLAFKIHQSLAIPLGDIVILTGYDARWRSYIDEAGRRQNNHPSIDWHQLQVGKIETFQGKEADIVIFDMVRTRSLGFMRYFQRLNVVFSHGVLYNRDLMHDDPFARSPFLMQLMDFAKSNSLVHTMSEPVAELSADLPTRNHDIQKANKSHEDRRSALKANINSLATEPVSPRHTLASVASEQACSAGFESSDPKVYGGWLEDEERIETNQRMNLARNVKRKSGMGIS